VVKRTGQNGKALQIESITFSWCDFVTALAYIERTLRGEDDANTFTFEVSPHLETAAQHGRCDHCA
jgi:hypothetical protein